MGGFGDDRRVTEYNPRTNTWRNMPSLQRGRINYCVCTLGNKIFVLGNGYARTCEMLDLSDDDPHWRYIAQMNSRHDGGAAVGVERKIYVLGGCSVSGLSTSTVEMYDVDQGILMEYLQIIIRIRAFCPGWFAQVCI